MSNKKVTELYFAINKETKEIFNTMGYGKNKISWAKLGHLKAIFTSHPSRLNIKDYIIYRVYLHNGIPMICEVTNDE